MSKVGAFAIMKLGIIGLPGSGKSTVFQTLTHSTPDQWPRKGSVISTVQVPDSRLDNLTAHTNPKKTVHAHLEYLLPGKERTFGQDKQGEEGPWSDIRPCDALVHIVRNFHLPRDDFSYSRKDWGKLDDEMMLADLVVVEKRIERIETDKKRGRKMHGEEQDLLERCLEKLEKGSPLRDYPDLARSPLLKGYALLSAKPILTVFNNDEDNEDLPPWAKVPALSHTVVVRGALEKELSELPSEQRETFRAAYNIETSAVKRLIHHSCQTLGLIAFFTLANREVRSWLIPKGTKALDAAGVIHTDMKKGFIRAEILAYDDLMDCGTYQQAKKEARVHLEGKDYVVQDGDVIYFRFNV
jgi:GTP-binding protein YchF